MTNHHNSIHWIWYHKGVVCKGWKKKFSCTLRVLTQNSNEGDHNSKYGTRWHSNHRRSYSFCFSVTSASFIAIVANTGPSLWRPPSHDTMAVNTLLNGTVRHFYTGETRCRNSIHWTSENKNDQCQIEAHNSTGAYLRILWDFFQSPKKVHPLITLPSTNYPSIH